MNFDPIRFVVVAMTVSIAGTSCADFSRGSAAGDGGAGDAMVDATVDGNAVDGGPLSFASDVHGIFVDGCQHCHAQGQQAGDTQFLLTGDAAADFAAVSAFVNTGAPAGSRALIKMSGQGHGGGTVYASDSTAYLTVLRWIQEGARQ
jgi:hypothetical protein